MNAFLESLYSDLRSEKIPQDRDIFGVLIGTWDILWIDHLDSTEMRSVKGEWLFSRVLDGTAVQDTFIVPSRNERKIHPQPDAEYGTTIRIYNPKTGLWDIFYGCMGVVFRLTGEKHGDELILTENTGHAMRYIFSDITQSSFKWRKEILTDEKNWKIIAKVEAMRG